MMYSFPMENIIAHGGGVRYASYRLTVENYAGTGAKNKKGCACCTSCQLAIENCVGDNLASMLKALARNKQAVHVLLIFLYNMWYRLEQRSESYATFMYSSLYGKRKGQDNSGGWLGGTRGGRRAVRPSSCSL